MAAPVDRRRIRIAGAGSSAAEALAGALALILAIVGLAGNAPLVMAAACSILVGGALLFEGDALTAHYAEAQRELEVTKQKAAVGGGVSAEFIAGAAGVVLGVLVLIGVAPNVLVHVSTILLGAGLLFGGGLMANSYRIDGHHWQSKREHRAAQAAEGAGNAEGIIGAGVVVLGVLALIGVGNPLTLSLVAYLALGAGVLVGGSAIAARLGMLARRTEDHRDIHHGFGRGVLSDHDLRDA